MRPVSRIVFVILTVLALAFGARAQSPREQLQQLTTQLQQTPNDDALRERIIKLGTEIRPAPAVPEEARRLFIRGNTAMSDAKSASDYARAAQFYFDASQIAPWWGDPYFNLSKARELQNDYSGAISSLRLFVMSAPPADDARKAQDYMYVLEERRDRQAQTQTQAAQKAAWPKELQQWLQRNYGSPIANWEICVDRRGFPECSEEEAQGSNWSGGITKWAGRNYRFTFGRPGCGPDQISLYYSFPDFTATQYCGTVGGPDIANVKWAWGGRPVEMKFLGKTIKMVECYSGSTRCKRVNWIFE